MADLASLNLSVKYDSVEKSTIAVREQTKAMGASERQAAKMKSANDNAARSFDDFSKRVRRNIQDLEFQTAQLKRSAAEQQRYEALRRAGVAATSAEGVAITNAVRALQAQQAALGQVSIGTRAAGAAAATATNAFRTMAATLAPIAVVLIAIQKAMAAFEFASGLDEAAEQIGVTARNLQALQFAATQSGVKMEQLDTGLTKFSQKMGEAAEGSKEMVEALTKLGVKNLDVAGNLRPTEDLLVDVAKAITAIDDPARRSAAAVDFFGKAGTRMLPVLAEIANGMDALGQKADAAGAIIDAKTIKILDDAADSMARMAQVVTASLAVGLGKLITIIEGVALAFSRLASSIKSWVVDAAGSIGDFLDGLAVEGARGAAMFVEAFASMPEALSDLFANAWSLAKSVTAQGINDITGWLAANAPDWMGLKGSGTNLDTSVTLRGSSGIGERITAAGAAAAADMQARADAARQERFSQSTTGRRATSTMGDAARTGTIGASTSAIKGSGDAAAKAAENYQKLITQLDLSVAAQDKMTDAAGRGEVAYEAMKIKLEAQEKALSIFGKALDENDPRLQKLEERMLKIAQLKSAESFAQGTTALKRENELLEKQIELMGQSPEIIAREIALIKARQEAEKAGTAVTQDAIEARRQSIEQNETLKNQAEELKKAQELWTAPLKSALESIQQTAADAFETMLESGKVNFQELGSVFKKIVLRMAAEFMSLALLRPVMNVIINAVGGGGGGVSSSASVGGLGTGNIGGGGIGDLLSSVLGNSGGSSSIGDMLGISGMFGTSVGTAGGITTVGAPIGGYTATLGANGLGTTTSAFGGSASGSSLSGGLTGSLGGAGSALGMVGGAFGLGMGAYSLASGGAKTTKGTIAGVGQMVGGALMMIPTGYTQIAGAIIMALSSIVPGLFGDENKIDYDREYGRLTYGSSGFFTSGGAWGANADAKNMEGPLAKMGTTMDAVFNAFGGVKDAGKVWGVALQSYKETYSAGGEFANATSFLVDPMGNQTQWGQGSIDTPEMIAMETAAGVATINSILDGAVGDITENMRRALISISNGKQTIEIIAQTISEVVAFEAVIESLKNTISPIGAAFAEIDQQFASLYETAAKYGLEKGVVDDAVSKARSDIVKGFDEELRAQMLAITDPFQAQREALLKEKEALIAANDDIVEAYGESASRMVQIEEYYSAASQELARAAKEAADNFLNSVKEFDISLRLSTLDITDPLQAARERLEMEKTSLIAMNDEIIATYGETASRIVQIEEYYNVQLIRIHEQTAAAANGLAQAAASSVSSLQDLIRTLSPGGAMSNLDPAGQLAGLRASYDASYAQASADPSNAALIDRTVRAAQEFAQSSQSFYGGSSYFNRDRDTILQQAMGLQSAIVTQSAGAISTMGGDTGAVLSLLQQLLAATNKSNDNSAERDATLESVFGLLLRQLANAEAA
jgi:hypothetical protein